MREYHCLMKGDLAFSYALWRMGKLPPERIPDVACDALEAGMDHPALRYLAGLNKPTSADIDTRFDDACRQLGVIPTVQAEVDAEFRNWIEETIPIASMIAKQILNGTVDPAEGWLHIPWRNDQPLGPVGVFFAFADRLGSVSFDDEFQRRLKDACRRFLAEVEPDTIR